MPMREANKGPEAFRTISEASTELGVPQHVLRFWESKFSFIRPMKRAGGRRFYRRQDLEVLKGVRVLLHEGGYTIKGVQRLHKEAGMRRLIGAGEGDMPPPASSFAAEDDPVADPAIEAASLPVAPERTAEPSKAGSTQTPSLAALQAPASAGAAEAVPANGILQPPARARLEAVLRDLERVKANVDKLLTESDG